MELSSLNNFTVISKLAWECWGLNNTYQERMIILSCTYRFCSKLEISFSSMAYRLYVWGENDLQKRLFFKYTPKSGLKTNAYRFCEDGRKVRF